MVFQERRIVSIEEAINYFIGRAFVAADLGRSSQTISFEEAPALGLVGIRFIEPPEGLELSQDKSLQGLNFELE